MIKYNTPQELFTAICDKIRSIDNTNEPINHQDIPDKIDELARTSYIKIFIDNLIQGVNNDPYNFNNNNITKILSKIFCNTNITSVDLPKCTTIESNAFNSCTNLTTVNLPECTRIKEGTFINCTNLVTVDLPKCTTIEYNAFTSCTSLTTVNLPECVDLGTWGPGVSEMSVFAYCTNLTTVNLPKCTLFGSGEFYNCTNLATVIFGADQMIEFGNIFDNSSIADGTGCIYVPDNLVDEYKSTYSSKNYQFKPLSELPSNLKEEYGYE